MDRRQATAAVLEAEWYNGNINDATYTRMCKALDVPAYPSAAPPSHRLSTIVRDLLTTPCDCDESWTARGRHSVDCRYQFVHDYLDDGQIASVVGQLQRTETDANLVAILATT